MNASPRAKSSHSPRLSLSIQAGEGIDELPASRARLRRWVLRALIDAGEVASAALTLRFVDQHEGLALNRGFRGQRHATNVLTFAYSEPPEVQADIVLCMPVLHKEAADRGIPLIAHLAHLVVHGVLHACGHDHEAPEEAQRMESLEAQILARLRFADPYAHEHLS